MTLSLRKSVWWTPILIATSNISNNWLIHKCCPSGLFWKMLSSRKIVMIFLNAFGSYFSFLHQVIALGTSWKMLVTASKLFFQSQDIHTLFPLSFFPSVRRSSRRWSKLSLNPTQDGPFPLKSVTHIPQRWNFIHQLKKIKKIYESRDTQLQFWWELISRKTDTNCILIHNF